jgi:hypothetical protein
MRLVGRFLAAESSSALIKALSIETPPSPLSTILPFGRDPDFVRRDVLLEEICVKLARSGRAALVGVGGVGYDLRDRIVQLVS